MSYVVIRAMRRGRLRVAALAAVLALGVLVGLAHSGIETDHMGKAVAVCLAVAASAAVAAIAGPRLGRLLPRVARARSWPKLPATSFRTGSVDGCARGDPAVLQVFRS